MSEGNPYAPNTEEWDEWERERWEADGLTLDDLTFRRVAQEGHARRGAATTVTRHTWQAIKFDGEILTSGHRTRKAAEEAAAEVIRVARTFQP